MQEIDKDLERERAICRKRYTSKRKGPGFETKEKFESWWLDRFEKQNRSCHYCETPISLIRKLIDADLLRARKAGTSPKGRGPNLELDRKEGSKDYRPDNCVLACYYCNNDKSYTLDDEVYKKFFGEARRDYFKFLATKLSRD